MSESVVKSFKSLNFGVTNATTNGSEHNPSLFSPYLADVTSSFTAICHSSLVHFVEIANLSDDLRWSRYRDKDSIR